MIHSLFDSECIAATILYYTIYSYSYTSTLLLLYIIYIYIYIYIAIQAHCCVVFKLGCFI